MEAVFRASGHNVTLEAQLEGRTGTVYTVPLLAEKDDQAILVMGHLEETAVPDELVQEFATTLQDTGATRGILCHAGPGPTARPAELSFWGREQLATTVGQALVAEALGLDAPGLDVHLHAPSDLTDVLPEAFLESETDFVVAEAATPASTYAAATTPSTPDADPELAVDMPLDFAALAAASEPEAAPAAAAVPTPAPAVAPTPSAPSLFDFASLAASAAVAAPVAATPVVAQAPALAVAPAAAAPPAPPTLDLPSDPGKGIELDVDTLSAFPEVAGAAPASVPVVPVPALEPALPYAPSGAPPALFAPPMSGVPAFVSGLPSPDQVASNFAPSIVAPAMAAAGTMTLPSARPAPAMTPPPAPLPNIGISSLVAAAQALARPPAAAPTMVPVIATVGPAGMMPQTTHRMLPMRLGIPEASAKVAQKLFGIDRAELILQPVHLFDYEVDSFKDGSLEMDTLDGRIEVNGSDKNVRTVDPDACNPDGRGLPVPNVTPTERVMRVNSERARQLAMQHIAKSHTKAVDVRIPDNHGSLYYAERRKVEPRPEQMRVTPLGVFLRPVWRLHGSNGQVDVDAVDGHEVFAEVRGNRTDAIIID